MKGFRNLENIGVFLVLMCHTIRVVPLIWYFSSVSVGIFPVFSQPIPKENLVGMFRYCTFGGNPFFPSQGGFCPLFDGPSPSFEGKTSSRWMYKKEFPQNFTKWSSRQILRYKKYPTEYRLVWATKLSLAAIGLVFPAQVLGYNFFIVESMTYQFLYRLKNLYDYRWQL